MKVVHVETGRHFYGGAQQVVWLLRGLRDADVDNLLVCPPDSGIDAAARSEGIRVANLDCAGDPDLVFAWRLRRVLEREQPDLLHAHGRRGADVLGGLAARLARVPAVVSRRVDHPEPRFVARLRYRAYDRIVAISDNVAAVLRASGVAPQRITIIRSSVAIQQARWPVERSRLAAEFGIADDAIAIAAAGQLIARKGHRYLLEAMQAAGKQLPAAQLVIFGQGRLEAELKAQASALGIAGRVRFAGFRDDLDSYLGAFDLFVHPALQEGLGVAMLKAAAAGVPVVAFDVAGAREAVVGGETGILVEPRHSRALADAILRLSESPTLRQRYAEAGRERMRREFSLETMVDRHIRLYDAVVHGAD